MSDLSIVHEYDDYYQEAYYAWNPFFPLADRDLRFYLGEQWDEQERQKLFEEGRNAYSFNLIRRNINLLSGYQRKNRLSSVVSPQESKDQKGADQLSDLLLYTLNAGDGYKFISEAFGGAIKTGFNLLTIWMDYRDDPVNGDIRFGREPYNGFITDPYFTQLDFSDCSYVIRRKYLSPQHTASLLPGQEKDVYSLAKMGWSRDDKFTWLPYQTQPNGQEFMAYNEFYKQGWENVPMLVDKETGEYTEWEGDDEGLRFMIRQYPQLTVVEKPKQYVECNIIVNDELMRTERNQFGLNEYPFTPLVGIWEPESEFWGLKMQSLVRCMIDPQREANRRRSQMIDMLDSSINRGWIAKKSSVLNPRSLFQTSQGKVIWTEEDSQPGDLTQIPPPQIPPGMFELQKQFDADIMHILGTNDAAFGQTENAQESGLMMMLRQGSAIVNLQDVFDNLRYAQRLISKKALKLIQTWTPEKVERIIGEKPDPQFYSKDFIKYDVTIKEGVLTDTQRQIYFKQLLDLYNVTNVNGQSPITPAMLVKAAPMQNKSELNKEIEENMKAQKQQAQQAQQIQQQVLSSQLELNKASAIEKLAGGKERFTRSVANMGLEDERAARAVDNRASASLDRARAMRELSSLDDERLLKYLNVVRLMEGMNRAQEEQIKEDDITISARGEQAAEPLMPENPLGAQMFSGQQENQPPVEV